MFKALNGKRLLIIGAYGMDAEIVKAAKEMGVYTITTDNHTNWDDAPAKKISDDAWDISWSDIETLSKICQEKAVDGIMAGFSERRVDYAQQLSIALNKPFYAEGADIEKIFDKLKFKAACEEAGIRVPYKYEKGSPVDYPVIVKPSDNGGSRGITICFSDEELEVAYEKALSFSDSGKVVIEEYLTSDEIMVYFTVHNDEVTLSAMCDRYMHKFYENITQLPVGYYYPSKYLSVFVKYNLEKYQKLIKILGIHDGLIAFQAFVKGKDVIPFDPTYRLDGTMAYHMIEEINHISVIKMLIHKSLTGSMGNDRVIDKLENPFFTHPCFELPILLGNGKISKIEGLDDINRIKDVVYVFQNHFEGEIMGKVADFSQILCRIHICAENNKAIEEAVSDIYNTLHVYDDNYKDMIIGRNTFEIGQ